MFVFWCVVFPVLRRHTFPRGPCTYLQVGGPAGGLARSPCLSEGKGSNALLGRRGSDPLLFGFVLVLVFALGHRDPRAYLFAGAIVVSPLGSHTHGFFFPPGPFFFSLSLSLSLSLLLLSGCTLRFPEAGIGVEFL